MDPGGVLDRVIASTKGAEKSILYQLANFRKGGILVDCFNKGGSKEVEKYVKENLSPLMYNHGKGEFITRTEYLRWKYRESEQIDMSRKKKDKLKHDPLHLWNDHEACWKMQHRGALGESLLHILVICNTLVHTRIARGAILMSLNCLINRIFNIVYSTAERPTLLARLNILLKVVLRFNGNVLQNPSAVLSEVRYRPD